MTAKTTTPADPTAGVPTVGVKTSKTAKAASTGGNVISINKKRKLSGQAYKDARDFARRTTGYDATSPIWGKRMNAVLVDLEDQLNQAIAAHNANDYISVQLHVEVALLTTQELLKRIATGQLIGAQS